MKKIAMIYRFTLTVLFLFISLLGIAHAVDFDARDTKVDLPVLSTPNNAITPQMSADQNGHVYVVWSDNRGGSPTVYLNTRFREAGWRPSSTPIVTGFPRSSGSTAGDATLPQVCSDSFGHVYVAWVDDRAVKDGTGKRDIYFRYSKDYGVTWFPEFTDWRLDSDNPMAGDSINPQMTCDENGNVYVVWMDDRNRAGIYEVYFSSLQVQFSDPTDFIVPYQQPEIRLNTGIDPGKFPALYPVISSDQKGDVYVAWQDERNSPSDSIYNGIYFNVSNNHGTTWSSKATRIDRAPVGFYQAINPAISSDPSGHVYVAWLDNGGRPDKGDQYATDGTLDVYFNRSLNYGVTWDEKDQRIDTVKVKRVDAKDVAIANNSRGVVDIVWASNKEATTKGVSTNFNIYSNHSENFGGSFLDSADNIRIDTGVHPGVTNASTPTARIDSLGDVFAAWVDKRPANSNIYLNFSIDRGRKDSWQGSDIRLDYPTPAGDSIYPSMYLDDLGHVYATWQDTRSTLTKDTYNVYFISGFFDIAARTVFGQRLGEACFIATAAYGSPFERHVAVLREFRDRFLLTNRMGQWFVSEYYQYSPPAARFISGHDSLKAAVRVALLPAVGIAWVSVHATPLQKVVFILFIILMIGTVSFIRIRR